MTEAMVDDALVEKVAAALEAAWNASRDLPPIDFVQRERIELANAVIAIAYPAGVAAGREDAAQIADRIAGESILALDEHDARVRHEGIVAGARVAATAIRQRGE